MKRRNVPGADSAGFTMMELLIVMGLASVLIFLATNQALMLYRGTMYDVSRSNLAQDSLTEANYLAGQITTDGGGAVLPWIATIVEDNCGARAPLPACNGSDRLTLITTPAVLQECPIVAQSISGTGGVVTLDSSAGCCLTAKAFPTFGQFMIVNGTNYAQVFENAAFDAGACTLAYTFGPAHFHDPGGLPGNWAVGGTLAAVTITTYYLDAQHNLMQYVDSHNVGALNPDTTQLVAAGVYDLQVALGYDVNGTNILTDDGTNTDCWLYNTPPSVPQDTALGAPGYFATTTANQLRMVELGLTLGMTNSFTNGAPSTPITAQLLNGPVVTQAAVDLRSVSFKVVPRNSYFFR